MPAMRVAPYKNITAPEDAPQIFKDMVEYTDTISNSVGEYFDYDTCSTLVDTSRNGNSEYDAWEYRTKYGRRDPERY